MNNVISVVIPTYNRPEQLSGVIDNLFNSDVRGFSAVQVVIVDDGSPVPCKEIVEQKQAPDFFLIQYVRQENAGPSAARNNGLRHAVHETVLFIDDDILVEPDLLVKHARGHQQHPVSVIYGYSPYVIPAKHTPAYRYLKKLIEVNKEDAGQDKYILMNSLASGNISVERSMFPNGNMYQSSLKVPAAEEFELMVKLQKMKAKVYFNPSITGWHLQPPTIEDKCKQELKYGNGIAEVSIKIPQALEHDANLRGMFYANCTLGPGGTKNSSFKKSVRSFFSKPRSRGRLLGLVKFTEKILPFDLVLFPLYSFLLGIYLYAGVNEGIQKFGISKSST